MLAPLTHHPADPLLGEQPNPGPFVKIGASSKIVPAGLDPVIAADVGTGAPELASNRMPLIVAPGSDPTTKLENWRLVEVQPLAALAGGVENGAFASGVAEAGHAVIAPNDGIHVKSATASSNPSFISFCNRR